MSFKIALYSTTLTKQPHRLIENISAFLNQEGKATIGFSNLSFPKIGINFTMKLPISNFENFDFGTPYNYAEIDNGDDSAYRCFAFIDKIDYIGLDVVNFSFTLDLLNTLPLSKDSFSNRTFINRQLIERFTKFTAEDGSVHWIARNTDKYVDEGITPQLVRGGAKIVAPSDPWYLIYKNSADGTPALYLAPMKKRSYTGTRIDFPLNNFQGNDAYKRVAVFYPAVFVNEKGQAKALAADEYMILSLYYDQALQPTPIIWAECYKGNGVYNIDKLMAGTSFSVYGADGFYSDKTSSTTVNPADIRNWTFAPAASRKITVYSIEQVDRSSSDIVKVVECPYIPTSKVSAPNNSDEIHFTGDAGIFIENGWMRFIDLEPDLRNHLNFTTGISEFFPYMAIPANEGKRVIDPKINSYPFFAIRLLYDSFSKEFDPAKLMPESFYDGYFTDGFLASIDYIQSSDISSSLIFIVHFDDEYRNETEDYWNVLVSTRNNALPLYSSDYLNYMRNGYNYDKKRQEQNNAYMWTSTGLQIGAAVAGFALAPFTGGISAVAAVGSVASAASSIYGNIKNQEQASDSIEQNIKQAKARAYSVASVDDFSLFKAYSGNALKYEIWKLRDADRVRLDQLFFYQGYKIESYAVPKWNCRKEFDYVQCAPVFNFPIRNDYLEALNNLFLEGVYIVHEEAKSGKTAWNVLLDPNTGNNERNLY